MKSVAPKRFKGRGSGASQEWLMQRPQRLHSRRLLYEGSQSYKHRFASSLDTWSSCRPGVWRTSRGVRARAGWRRQRGSQWCSLQASQCWRLCGVLSDAHNLHSPVFPQAGRPSRQI